MWWKEMIMTRQKWVNQLLQHADELSAVAQLAKRQAQWVVEGNYRYVVSLSSLWADHGEMSTETIGNPQEGLKSVEERADVDFKRLNRRSDIQADESVYLVFPDGSRWRVLAGARDTVRTWMEDFKDGD
jgi:hypothetical protein